MLKKQEKKSLTVEIDVELLVHTKLLAKSKGLKLREIVEYGMRAFIASHVKDNAPDKK